MEGLADFLGTDTVSPQEKKFHAFEDARFFACQLGFKKQKEWREWAKTGERPDYIPSSPDHVYKEKGWISWGNFLGTGYVSTKNRSYCPFEEARAFARKLGLKSRSEWTEWAQSNKRPDNIPKLPSSSYAKKGWTNWGDFLGTGNIAPKNRLSLSFIEARNFARGLELETVNDWKKWAKTDERPDEIPRFPYQTYANKGWISYSDFLGTTIQQEFLPFAEARSFARSLKLKSGQKWREWARTTNKPDNIPIHPNDVYKNNGWIGWGDWLGTGVIANQNRQYRPFEDARRFARSLDISTKEQWGEWAKTEDRPDDIPANPSTKYNGGGWTGWGDWLGTGVIAHQDRQFRPFEEAREFARSLNLSGKDFWIDWTKTEARPTDIPAYPNEVYKELGWLGWGDWVGNVSCWNINNIRAFLSSLIPHLDVFSPAELYLLFQQSGVLRATGVARDFVKAVSTGRFPINELDKFVNGEASAVDRFISGEIESLENSSDFSSDDDLAVDAITIDPNKVENSSETDVPYILPSVKTKAVLGAIDAATRVVSIDAEAIEFLIVSGTAKIWQDAFQDVDCTRKQALAFEGGEYAMRVREKFLSELREAENLPLPAGYAFSPNGKLEMPNLMQRLVASQIKLKRNLGNWSGTGAGKTLSAVLASRVIDARLTIICCPNSVVGGSPVTGHGWADEICNIFPDSEVQTKTFAPIWSRQDSHCYLVLNYELFQKPDSPEHIRRLLDSAQIDMIVIDEVHYSKQRSTNKISRRRELVTALITEAREQNQNLCVLGLSATPVINNLQEGKSLLEMITGVQYPELETRATVANCMRLHQQMVVHGFRWKPNYKIGFKEKKIDIDCSEYIAEIRALGVAKGSPHALEKILTKARLSTIREQCLPGEKTLIYTHYVSGITEQIASVLRQDGHQVGLYIGEDKSGLESFLHGDLNVLIGSAAIGTGVDGLQRVCDRLIVNVLPWTNSEYEQLKGRILRQGQQSNLVTIVLPITYADVDGERWSWDDSKLNRLHWKKSVADAAIDGIVPEGHLRTADQAYRDLMNWLERISEGKVGVLQRPFLTIPLPDNDPKYVEKRLARYGDFSKMNQRWNQSLSNKTHARLEQDPEEWYQYHTLYQRARESWPVIPYEEMIKWCREREGFNYEIGDFGCGEAKLAEAVSDIHTVHSFDHIAVNSNVISCDITAVPLGDETLDVVLFSLSLMGKNFTDYLKEAHRTLRLDGHLIIFEPSSRFLDDHDVDHSSTFAKDLEQLGFTSGTIEIMDRFTRIQAMKRSRSTPNNDPQIYFKSQFS